MRDEDIAMDFYDTWKKVKSIDFDFDDSFYSYLEFLKRYYNLTSVDIEDFNEEDYTGIVQMGPKNNLKSTYFRNGKLVYGENNLDDGYGFQKFFNGEFELQLTYSPDLSFARRSADFDYGNGLKGYFEQNSENDGFLVVSGGKVAPSSLILKLNSFEKWVPLKENIEALTDLSKLHKAYGNFNIGKKSTLYYIDKATRELQKHDVRSMSFAEALDILLPF